MSKKKRFQFSDVGVVNPADPYQKIIPYGSFDTAKYGKVDFDASFCARIVANWKAKVMGNRQPFVDVNHDRGEAQGWITGLEARADGLYASLDWTPAGKPKVEGGLYKYFSADLAEAKNIVNGESYWPVLVAVSLTNVPVLNVLPEVKLGELTTGEPSTKIRASLSPTDSAHGDGAEGDPKKQESNMDFEKILAFLKSQSAGLTPEQKKALHEALGMPEEMAAAKQAAADAVAASEKAVAASETLKTKLALAEKEVADAKAQAGGRADQSLALAERLKVLEAKLTDTERESVIGSALKAGKIKPADKEKWEKRFADSPKATAEILSEMPANPSFSEAGTAGKPSEFQATEVEMELGMKLGYTREAWAKILKEHGGVPVAAK